MLRRLQNPMLIMAASATILLLSGFALFSASFWSPAPLNLVTLFETFIAGIGIVGFLIGFVWTLGVVLAFLMPGHKRDSADAISQMLSRR